MKTAVILPAAGAGRRFNDDTQAGQASKVELELAGKPVFLRSIDLFLRRDEVSDVLLAVAPDKVDAFTARWGDTLRFHGVRIVPGGTVERWETVTKALAEVPAHCTHVAVHDAARPMASDALIDRIFTAAAKHDAVVPGLAVTSTLKRVEAAAVDDEPEADPLDAIFGDVGKPTQPTLQQVVETVPRAGLVAVQTPQVFTVDLLRRAYAPIIDGKLDPAGVTDDASLVEALGERVYVVEGDAGNMKLTRREDVPLFEAIIARRDADEQAERSRRALRG
ncbi:2-C-methyl-D-erythritol 4-phosphate cytidylyltransferase [Phycisphaerales bacterium AB-hyl4]|uniref:2-C-methyl-D-erythritol 4-phosphate cytidylyltransferase n=1 Tax=Natronomicrosphaera hydrolytica TaxID=3242702 RepID=A0ABV4U7W5_9BACT